MSRSIFYIPTLIITIALSCCSQDFPNCGDSKVSEILKSEIFKKYDTYLSTALEVNVSIAEEISFDNKKPARTCKAVIEVQINKDIVSKFNDLESNVKKLSNGEVSLYWFKDESKKMNFSDKVNASYVIKKNEVDKGIFIEGSYASDSDYDLNPLILKLVDQQDSILKYSKPLGELVEFNNKFIDDSPANSDLISIITENNLKIEYCQLLQPKNEVLCKITNSSGFVDIISTKPIIYSPDAIDLVRTKMNVERKIIDPSDISELFSTSITFKSKEYKRKVDDLIPDWAKAWGIK